MRLQYLNLSVFKTNKSLSVILNIKSQIIFHYLKTETFMFFIKLKIKIESCIKKNNIHVPIDMCYFN